MTAKQQQRLAANLIEARGEMTQKEVAGRARLTTNYVSLIECGRRTPSLDVLASLAKCYGVTMESLFKGV